jgi:hypothetical protein
MRKIVEVGYLEVDSISVMEPTQLYFCIGVLIIRIILCSSTNVDWYFRVNNQYSAFSALYASFALPSRVEMVRKAQQFPRLDAIQRSIFSHFSHRITPDMSCDATRSRHTTETQGKEVWAIFPRISKRSDPDWCAI